MSFIFHSSDIKSLKPKDPGYHLVDGYKLVPRALIAITKDCPDHVKDYLKFAIDRGWVVPIANIYKHEETFNILSDKA